MCPCLGVQLNTNWKESANSLALVKCVPQPISQSSFSQDDNKKVKPITPRSFSFAGVCHSWKKAHTHRNNCHPNSALQGLGARGLWTLSESVMNSSFSVALDHQVLSMSLFFCIAPKVQKCSVSRVDLLVTNAYCASMNTPTVVVNHHYKNGGKKLRSGPENRVMAALGLEVGGWG